jgi:hypothetical protein
MWTVAKDKTDVVDGAIAFSEFLLMSFNGYLDHMYEGDESGPEVESLMEWLDNGNKLQVTYRVDGIYIVPILNKEEKNGFSSKSNRF